MDASSVLGQFGAKPPVPAVMQPMKPMAANPPAMPGKGLFNLASPTAGKKPVGGGTGLQNSIPTIPTLGQKTQTMKVGGSNDHGELIPEAVVRAAAEYAAQTRRDAGYDGPRRPSREHAKVRGTGGRFAWQGRRASRLRDDPSYSEHLRHKRK